MAEKAVLKIAHRGASFYLPENTIGALKKSLDLKADAVEFDIHRTKDGQIILMHDSDLKRTTDGHGLIRNLTLEEIRRFRTLNGEPIPTLQEALDLLKDKCTCTIEIKDRFMEKEVLDIVRKYNMQDSVIIGSKIFSVLKKVRKLDPKIKLELIFRENGKQVTKKIAEIRAEFIAPHYSKINSRLIKKAHKNNLKVHVWTVNDEKVIEKMKKLGVDGITSDCPDKI